jgi:tetratricopeptide (TPR) repeat protein
LDVTSQGNENTSKQLLSRAVLLGGLIILVGLVVLIAHWPALSAKTLSFDDHQYLVDNELVQNPSWASVGRFLTEVFEPSTVQGYYQPLTMISLMLDYAAGGKADYLVPFHRTSLILHLANTALIIIILYLLFHEPVAAVAVGLLFGLHPMTVEPIPWIGERKTLLAAFFALSSLVLYIYFVRKNRWRFYTGCLAMYILALLSKPTSIPLPMLMLLLDYWPLNRLKIRTILEKLPFFIVGAIFVVITYISQTRTCGTQLPAGGSLLRIPLILCHNIVFYLYKMVWPVNLSSHYAFPSPFSLAHPMVLAGVIGTCILVPLLVISLRWTRAPLTGWLFFFAAILPTMQIVGFTNVIASDKFAYLPALGVLLILAVFLGRLWKTGTRTKILIRRLVIIGLVLVLAAAETIVTRKQLTYWRDTESYYKYMLTLTPNVASLHFNLAFALDSQQKLDEAEEHYQQAIQLDPNDPSSHHNLAYVLELQGKLDDAVKHYQQALRIKPSNLNSYNNLSLILLAQGKLDEAVKLCCQALEIKPDYAPAHYNLGNILAKEGKLDEAVSHYRQAIGSAALRASAKYNLAIILQKQGKFDEAITYYRQALQVDPELVYANFQLGNLLAQKGEVDEALIYYRQALRIDPNYAAPLDHMARILATHPDQKLRDVNKAIEFAERAAGLTEYEDAAILDTLALTYAAAGQFDRAIATAQSALDLPSAVQNDELANHIRKQLELYKQAKP